MCCTMVYKLTRMKQWPMSLQVAKVVLSDSLEFGENIVNYSFDKAHIIGAINNHMQKVLNYIATALHNMFEI